MFLVKYGSALHTLTVTYYSTGKTCYPEAGFFGSRKFSRVTYNVCVCVCMYICLGIYSTLIVIDDDKLLPQSIITTVIATMLYVYVQAIYKVSHRDSHSMISH